MRSDDPSGFRIPNICPIRFLNFLSGIGITVILSLIMATGVQAQILVTSTSGGVGGPDCTLRDAIRTAIDHVPTGGCAIPSGGSDVVVLEPGATYTLYEVDNVDADGPNGLPTLAGFGAFKVEIQGNGATIERSAAPGTPDFRIIKTEMLLTISDLTIRNGRAPHPDAIPVLIDFEGLSLGAVYPGTSLSSFLPSNPGSANYQVFASLEFGNFDPDAGLAYPDIPEIEIKSGGTVGSMRAICPAAQSIRPTTCTAVLNVVFEQPAIGISFDVAASDSEEVTVAISFNRDFTHVAYASVPLDGSIFTPDTVTLADLSYYEHPDGTGAPVAVNGSTEIMAFAVNSADDPVGLTFDNIAFTLGACTPVRLEGSGGAVLVRLGFGVLDATDVLFENNWARCNGGAVASVNGYLQIIGSEFSNNTTSTEIPPSGLPGSAGGAISYFDNLGYLMIEESSFIDNAAYRAGAVSACCSGPPYLMGRNLFQENTAVSDGGAVVTSWQPTAPGVAVQESTFIGNQAGGAGGAILVDASMTGPGIEPLLIEGTTIAGNLAELGGGIAIAGGPLPPVELFNSTVSGNLATFVGGIFNKDGTLHTLFSTITGNSGIGGTGIAAGNGTGSNSANTRLTATIVSDQQGGSDCGIDGVWVSDGFNLDSDGTCGLGVDDIQMTDPMLDTLKNNGGATRTHALLFGSPAIDVIDVPGPGSVLEGHCGGGGSDQRGVPRPQGARCDIGAYEVDMCVNGETRPCYSGPSGTVNVGVCSTGLETCVDGIFDGNCDGETIPSVADSSCDGLDNDCDGKVDEDFVSEATSCGVGACAGNQGQTTCVAGGVIDSCDPFAGASVDTVCDDLDNDCDGEVDEDFVSEATSCGVGVCAGNQGQTTCVDGGVVNSCDPFAGASVEGPVCDGLDNDCDGLIDEDCRADCSNAVPSQSILWPPNHEFIEVAILGVIDQDDDDVALRIDGIYQDEPVDTLGDGSFTPDGQGVGTDRAQVRAERTGTPKIPGDGRVYHIRFSVTDDTGGTCSGTVSVGVPHDEMDIPVDGGAVFDSTLP